MLVAPVTPPMLAYLCRAPLSAPRGSAASVYDGGERAGPAANAFLMTARIKFLIVFCSTLLTVMLVIGALMGKEPAEEGAYRPLRVYSDVLPLIVAQPATGNAEPLPSCAAAGSARDPQPLSADSFAISFTIDRECKDKHAAGP